ncbi:MAG: hypothetical protein ACREUE_11025 [Panacagrimonas sp.]
MADPLNLLLSAFSGGGSSARLGDIVVVKFPASTFAASALDYKMVQNWARGRLSLGNANRDRSAFVDRFENVLARSGGGVATRGNRPALKYIVKGLTLSGMDMLQWSVPHNINESMEAQRRPGTPGPAERGIAPSPSSGK